MPLGLVPFAAPLVPDAPWRASGADLYWPHTMLGFCVVGDMSWGSRLLPPPRRDERSNRSLVSAQSAGRGKLTSSYAGSTRADVRESPGLAPRESSRGRRQHTSNDWTYQSRTRPIDGISLSPSGRCSSSSTRCASRMGSSSDRNCEARNRVPVDGFTPNCTICCSETPGRSAVSVRPSFARGR